jgi:hypothetical protein
MIAGADALMFTDKKGDQKMKYSSLKVLGCERCRAAELSLKRQSYNPMSLATSRQKQSGG